MRDQSIQFAPLPSSKLSPVSNAKVIPTTIKLSDQPGARDLKKLFKKAANPDSKVGKQIHSLKREPLMSELFTKEDMRAIQRETNKLLASKEKPSINDQLTATMTAVTNVLGADRIHQFEKAINSVVKNNPKQYSEIAKVAERFDVQDQAEQSPLLAAA